MGYSAPMKMGLCRTSSRCAAALLAVASASAPALAFEFVRSPLPMMAANPQGFAGSASGWTAIEPAAGFTPFSVYGGLGMAGRSGFSGYKLDLGNKLSVNLNSGGGYAGFASGPAGGYQFSSTNVQFNYDMGRFRPFVAFGVANVRPGMAGGFLPGADPVANFLNGQQPQRNFTSASAGFNFAVTNNISFGAAVTMQQGARPLSPFGLQGLQ